MKRLIVLSILFLSSIVWASMPSNEFTDDALVTRGKGIFNGVIVVTDGTNLVKMTIYDYNNAEIKGATVYDEYQQKYVDNNLKDKLKLMPTIDIPTAIDDRYRLIFSPVDIPFYKGIYVDVETTGSVKYMIYYKIGNKLMR